jgi:catechol 2,3-dioxygenase-like lactoylglutathione lyase family enzyme
MFKGLAHVCLNVRDLKRSIKYYSSLGFKLKFRFTRQEADIGAYMEISQGSYIEIFENRNMADVSNSGIAHFCVEAEDIDSVIHRLEQLGIPFTPKKLGCDNTWQVWLKDPDNNEFEVHQYTGKSSQRTGESVEADW